MKNALLTVLAVLLIDQGLKIWIKLNFELGETLPLLGTWFEFQFVENPGMAFGWMLPGNAGKLALSIFRLGAIAAICVYLWRLTKEQAHKQYVICIALILAGAVGNILDSAFYGLLFDSGMVYNPDRGYYDFYFGKSILGGEGYAPFLMGNVVDMLHFPILKGYFPDWMPIFGGQRFEFFRPVFNVADSSITIGVAWIVLKQRSFFGNKVKQSGKDLPSDDV